MCVCVCIRACVRSCVRARALMHACVRACALTEEEAHRLFSVPENCFFCDALGL